MKKVKAVFDGSDREPAVHMESRLEMPGREKSAVHPPELESQDVDEEARSAVAAENAGVSFQSKGRGLAADDADGVGRVDGFGHVSRAVDDLAIVAVTKELGDWLGSNLGRGPASPE